MFGSRTRRPPSRFSFAVEVMEDDDDSDWAGISLDGDDCDDEQLQVPTIVVDD